MYSPYIFSKLFQLYIPPTFIPLHLLRYFLYSTCPLLITYVRLMGVGGERRIRNQSKVNPEKAAPVTGTVLRTTSPVPMDFRQ